MTAKERLEEYLKRQATGATDSTVHEALPSHLKKPSDAKPPASPPSGTTDTGRERELTLSNISEDDATRREREWREMERQMEEKAAKQRERDEKWREAEQQMNAELARQHELRLSEQGWQKALQQMDGQLPTLRHSVGEISAKAGKPAPEPERSLDRAPGRDRSRGLER